MAIKFKIETKPAFALKEITTNVVSFKVEVAIWGINRRRELLEIYKGLLFNKEVEVTRVAKNIASDALAEASKDTDAFTTQWDVFQKADAEFQAALNVQDEALTAFYFNQVQRLYDLPIKDEASEDTFADTSVPSVLGLQDSQEALAVLLEQLGDNPVVRDAIVTAVEFVFTNVNKDDAAVKN